MKVSTESFIGRLRHLVDDFHLISPEEEKQATEYIVQRVDELSDYLLKELEKRSNNQDCISREELETLLASISLPKQSVDLVTAELSLCSISMS